MPYLILWASRNPDLLQHRTSLLTNAGYLVVSASNSPEIVNKLLNGDFDLVLLCQTLNREERQRLGHIISGYTPSTPVLEVCDCGGQCDSPELHVAPNEVVQAVEASIRRAGRRHSRQEHRRTAS